MSDIWESEIGGLLGELAEVQTALLGTLNDKRQLLADGNVQALSALAPREQELADRLQACHERRQQLLARANADGLPADSIQSLSERLPTDSRNRVNAIIREAAGRTQLLQHQSLANWVLVQRSLLHLSQLIEIIATGGRTKPTYGKGSDGAASGALVDRAA
jgi:flagellar biosynthesis/type III secretory pathway chaperone